MQFNFDPDPVGPQFDRNANGFHVPHSQYPYSPDAEFQEMVAQRIQLDLKCEISEYMLFQIERIEKRTIADFIGNKIVFDIKALIHGLENRVEEVETQRETKKTDTVLMAEYVPRTWWDAIKSTHVRWLRKQAIEARFSLTCKVLLKLARRIELGVNLRRIDIKHHHQTDDVHILVTKHWHVCPHLQTDPQHEHFRFLAEKPDAKRKSR